MVLTQNCNFCTIFEQKCNFLYKFRIKLHFLPRSCAGHLREHLVALRELAADKLLHKLWTNLHCSVSLSNKDTILVAIFVQISNKIAIFCTNLILINLTQIDSSKIRDFE